MNSKFTIGQDLELVVYDFDGVMTDNKVVLQEDGTESVIVNRSDGLAVSLIKGMGIRQMIITSEINKVVEKRANKLDIPLIQGILDKKEALMEHCERNSISMDKVIYVGNDINDLEAMLCVGYPICPLNAVEEIKEISKIVLPVTGGNGVVRELLRYIKKLSVIKEQSREKNSE